MVEGVIGGKIRGSQVKITISHKDLQVGIAGDCLTQGLGDIYIPVFIIVVRPGPDAVVEDFIRQITLIFKLTADVIVQGSSVRSHNGIQAGVELRKLAHSIAVETFKPGIQAANCPPLLA